MITEGNNALLEPIPPSELESHQVVVTEQGEQWPTYRFTRTPSTIDELLQYKEGVAVLMSNGAFVYINIPIEEDNYDDLSWAERKHDDYFFVKVVFDDRTETTFQITGVSEEKSLETAVLFTRLSSSSNQKIRDVSIKSYGLHYEEKHVDLLGLFLDAASTSTKIIVCYSDLDTVFSAVIASRPYLIHLELWESTLDATAFTERLQARTTSFGTLTLTHSSIDVDGLTKIFDHLIMMDHIDAPSLPKNLLLKLLASPAKSIAFQIHEDYQELNLATADIAPKKIVVKLAHALSPQFVCSFFFRVAELGHLESLTIESVYFHMVDPFPVAFGYVLMFAISANKNLKVFELYDKYDIWGNCFKDILCVLEFHEGVRELRMEHYPYALDPGMARLQQLLKRNRRIELTDRDGRSWRFGRETERLCELNRFYRGSPLLTKEQPSTRLSLVGAALAHSAASDFPRTGILLANHADLFCQLVQAQVLCDDVEGGPIETNEGDLSRAAASVEVERVKRQKRKRTSDS